MINPQQIYDIHQQIYDQHTTQIYDIPPTHTYDLPTALLNLWSASDSQIYDLSQKSQIYYLPATQTYDLS